MDIYVNDWSYNSRIPSRRKDKMSTEKYTELLAALKWMVQLYDEHANRGAFSNGVTDPSGSIDEGDVRASRIIEEAKAAIQHAEQLRHE